MKRIITVLGLLAALMAASAGSAQADPTGGETCSGHVKLYNYWESFGITTATWNISDYHYCVDQEIYSVEVQHTTDGGNHAYDWTPDAQRRSGVCNGGCYSGRYQISNSTCANTGSYRIHFWWAGGDKATVWHGAGIICAGYVQTD